MTKHYQHDIDRAEAAAGVDFNFRADELAYAFVKKMAWTGEKFTGEDVRRYCQSRGLDAVEPRAFGAVMQRLVRAKLIRPAGFTETGNRQAHGRMVRRWRATL